MAADTSAAPLAGIDVAVLAGGLGTRIRSVLGDIPKVLAPIEGRPFLEHLLDWLVGFGAQRVVLCLGHHADQVVAHVEANRRSGLAVEWVIETAPLGTAGALRLARPLLTSDPVFALNGDTFLDADLGRFVSTYHAAAVGLGMLCVEVPSIARFGSVERDAEGLVARFVEKDAEADRPGLISAGMYLLSAAVLDRLSGETGSSLERDFLQILPPQSIAAAVSHGRFIDIGTPESLAAAASVIVPGLVGETA